MKHDGKSLLRQAFVATWLLLWATASPGEDGGGRPVRLVVPFSPGGSTDVLARIMAPALGKALGQVVVIENRAGAGGMMATNEMLAAPPDGQTFAMATASTTAANPAIQPRPPYRPSDLTAIVNLAVTPTVIAVHPGFPAKDYAGFLAELKRRPGHYAYASSGVGSISHLQMENFKIRTGTFITHIPYRGAGPALNDVVSGQVQILMDALPSASPFIRSGRLRAIAVTAPTRLASLPDVPTLLEVGLPEMNRMSAFGLVGPKGMPAEVVRRINQAARVALEDPGVRQRIADSGAEVVGGTPEQYASHLMTEYLQLKRVVEERKLKPVED
jgi:tripartite-type tricarboxylate transporter receptor subunit TctC